MLEVQLAILLGFLILSNIILLVETICIQIILLYKSYSDVTPNLNSNFERPFSWLSSQTMTTHYHLSYVSKNANNIHVGALEPLPYDFRHEADWSCSICLDNDTQQATCVKTLCQHVFHESCLLNYKHVFLEQEANCYKTCIPCPLCRRYLY